MENLEIICEREFDGSIEKVKVWKVREDTKMRYFSQIETDEGKWLVDPVEGESLINELESGEDLRGIIVIHDRHWRDAADLAEKYSTPVYVPEFFSNVPEEIDSVIFFDEIPELGLKMSRIYDFSFWQEAIVYSDRLLFAGDSLGTSPLMGRKDLYINPFMRVVKPRNSWENLDPEEIFVGHGPPVTEDAASKLCEASEQSRISGFYDLARFVIKALARKFQTNL